MRKFFGDQLWCLTTLKLAETNKLIISDLRFKVEAELSGTFAPVKAEAAQKAKAGGITT